MPTVSIPPTQWLHTKASITDSAWRVWAWMAQSVDSSWQTACGITINHKGRSTRDGVEAHFFSRTPIISFSQYSHFGRLAERIGSKGKPLTARMSMVSRMVGLIYGSMRYAVICWRRRLRKLMGVGICFISTYHVVTGQPCVMALFPSKIPHSFHVQIVSAAWTNSNTASICERLVKLRYQTHLHLCVHTEIFPSVKCGEDPADCLTNNVNAQPSRSRFSAFYISQSLR